MKGEKKAGRAALLLNSMMKCGGCGDIHYAGSVASAACTSPASHIVPSEWMQRSKEAKRIIKMNKRLKSQCSDEALIHEHPQDNPCFAHGMPVLCLPWFLGILIYYVILMGLMKPPSSAVPLNESKDVEIIHLPQIVFR